MTGEELLERALSHFDEEDWEGGAELLRDGLERHGEDPAMHCWLGVAERELGLEGIAYERFKRALALEPTDPYVLATAGNGVASFDDEAAEPALRTAALTAPDVALTRMLYGAYLAREGMVAEGVAELTAARALDEDDPQVAYELGVAHALAGSFEEANDAFSDAVRLDPDDGWAHVVFGLTLLEAERLEEASGELLMGARRSADDIDAQLAAALAAAASGRDDLAYELLEHGRMTAAEGDLPLLGAVESRIDEGAAAASRMLEEDLVPRLLHTRLRERP